MADEWIRDDAKTLTEPFLSELRELADLHTPLIVEHRFYRGSRSPYWFVCGTGRISPGTSRSTN